MKRYTIELKLIFIFLICIVILNIFLDNFILLVHVKNVGIVEFFFNSGSSMIEIILILWAFFVSEKVILKYKNRGKQYRHLIDLSPEAIIVHRKEKILYINQAGAKLLGANSQAEILCYCWKEILHPDSYVKFQSLEEESLLIHSYKAKRLDGTIFDLEIISTNIEFDGQPAREVIARDVTSRKKKEAIVKQFAYQDDLTGLPNRRFFMNTISQLMTPTEKPKSGFAIMFIDLDGFKQINDSFGHDYGDDFLKDISDFLKECVSEKDIVARLGGDEFTILLTNATKDESAIVAKKIINNFDTYRFTFDKDVKVTPSIGIALYPQNGNDVETLINQADYAMYQVKQQGKNGYKFVNVYEWSMK